MRRAGVERLGELRIVVRAIRPVGLLADVVVGQEAPLGVGILSLVREGLVTISVLVLAVLGARRIDVTWYGKAGTLAVMFAFPLFLVGSADEGGWSELATWAAWGFVVPGLALGYIALAQYVPLGIEAVGRK